MAIDMCHAPVGCNLAKTCYCKYLSFMDIGELLSGNCVLEKKQKLLFDHSMTFFVVALSGTTSSCHYDFFPIGLLPTSTSLDVRRILVCPLSAT